MAFLDWFVGILLFILALGVLICIHELGHFLTAKLFNVYCVEFSIGFGPKIFSRRGINKKTGKQRETRFSIRAIPLGGYVSMYGEEVELEDGVTVPESRSLDGVAKWKRAIIFAAGIILNFILGFVLILSSNAFFPNVRPTYYYHYKEDTAVRFVVNTSADSIAQGCGINENDMVVMTQYVNADQTNVAYIITDSVPILQNDGTYEQYVLASNPFATTKNEPNFTSNMVLYHRGVSIESIIDGNKVSMYAPDFSKETHATAADENLIAKFKIQKAVDNPYESPVFVDIDVPISSYRTNPDKTSDTAKYAYKDIGMSFKLTTEWRTFGQVFADSWNDFINANTAIGKAIIGLFTGSSWNQIGGPIKIAEQIVLVNSNYGFGMYLYYAGFISVNLALFNLLPFPGLDGWSLLVTLIEAISRKKISNKVKNIFSVVGLILLFGLMIVIAIKDIISFF